MLDRPCGQFLKITVLPTCTESPPPPGCTVGIGPRGNRQDLHQVGPASVATVIRRRADRIHRGVDGSRPSRGIADNSSSSRTEGHREPREVNENGNNPRGANEHLTHSDPESDAPTTSPFHPLLRSSRDERARTRNVSNPSIIAPDKSTSLPDQRPRNCGEMAGTAEGKVTHICLGRYGNGHRIYRRRRP